VLGQPGERKGDSKPHCLAVRCVQRSLPKGRPRTTLRRSVSNSAAVCGCCIQGSPSRGIFTGQSLNSDVSAGAVWQRRPRPPPKLETTKRPCHSRLTLLRWRSAPCFTGLPQLSSIRYAAVTIPVRRSQRRAVPDRRTPGVEVRRPDRANLRGHMRRGSARSLKERM